MQTYMDEHKLIDQLRKCRLRATGQRLAVMQTLLETRNHPSAEDIFQKLKRSHPTLSLSTVYKTLQMMADMGALLTIETGSGSQRFDGHTHPHHHAVCTKCNKVLDVDFDRYPIDLNKKEVLADFDVQGIKITFSGTCQVCKAIMGKVTAPPASD